VSHSDENAILFLGCAISTRNHTAAITDLPSSMASPSIPLFAQRQDSISAQRLLPPSELQDERSSPDLKKELKEAATHFEACKVRNP
jgi:hypothetical protein